MGVPDHQVSYTLNHSLHRLFKYTHVHYIQKHNLTQTLYVRLIQNYVDFGICNKKCGMHKGVSGVVLIYGLFMAPEWEKKISIIVNTNTVTISLDHYGCKLSREGSWMVQTCIRE